MKREKKTLSKFSGELLLPRVNRCGDEFLRRGSSLGRMRLGGLLAGAPRMERSKRLSFSRGRRISNGYHHRLIHPTPTKRLRGEFPKTKTTIWSGCRHNTPHRGGWGTTLWFGTPDDA